jgi:hypothetical protein
LVKEHFHFEIGSSLINGFESSELSKRMVLSAGITNVNLVCWSRSEITCPVRMRTIAIWKAIICFYGKHRILFLNSFNVLAWSRIFIKHCSIANRIHIFDHFIHALIVLLSIHISKVITESHEHLVMMGILQSLLKIFIHLKSQINSNIISPFHITPTSI